MLSKTARLSILRYGAVLPLLFVFCQINGWSGEPVRKELSPQHFLPADTFLYLTLRPWDAWTSAWKGTDLAKVLQEKEVQQFLAGPLGKLATATEEAATPAGQPAPQPSGSYLDAIGKVIPGPAIVALSQSEIDRQEGKLPAAALIIGTQEVNEIFKGLMNWVGERLIKLELYQSASLLIYESPHLQMQPTFTLYRRHLIFASTPEFCKEIIDGLAGTLANKLADSKAFQTTGLTGNEHLAAYLNISGFKAAMGLDNETPFAKLLKGFGFDQAQSIGWSVKIEGTGFESQTALAYDAQRAGWLADIAPEPLSPEALQICPPDSPFTLGARIRPEGMLGCIKSVVQIVSGKNSSENVDALEKSYKDQGRNLSAELAKAFEGEIVVTLFGSHVVLTRPTQAVLVGLKIKDWNSAKAFVEDSMKRIALRYSEQPEAVLRSTAFMDVPIHYLQPGAQTGGSRIKVAITERHVLFSSDIHVIRDAIKTAKGPNLAGAVPFTQTLAASGGKLGSVMMYMDWGWCYESIHQLCLSAMKLMENSEVFRNLGIDLNLVPSKECISKHFYPSLSRVQLEENRMIVTSRGPLPSPEVLTPPALACYTLFTGLMPKAMSKPAPKP